MKEEASKLHKVIVTDDDIDTFLKYHEDSIASEKEKSGEEHPNVGEDFLDILFICRKLFREKQELKSSLEECNKLATNQNIINELNQELNRCGNEISMANFKFNQVISGIRKFIDKS